MPKRRPKSRRHLKNHTYIRAAQRLGICLDAEQQAAIVADIQANKGEFVEKQSRNRTIWKIVFNSQIIGVVYDKRFKSLVTIIPKTDPIYSS
jgi:hypothetical protein